jgi:hypothetical protein
LFSSYIFPQTANIKPIESVKIIYAKINFEGFVTTYKPGKTKVYPPAKVPVQERYYKLDLRIRLYNNNYIIKGPMLIKCFLSNGDIIKRLLYPEHEIFYANKIYDFTFDIYSQNSFFGQAKIELINTETEIMYDKTDLFIQ